MVANERSTYVIDKLWSVILPRYEYGFHATMSALNDCMRLGITESEVIASLSNGSGLSLSEKYIRANIGENIYHVTLASNLPKIIKEGLEPKICDVDTSWPYRSSIPAVFMAKSPSYGSCICGSARLKSNQAVIELCAEQIEIFQINSIGHKNGDYNPHMVTQVGSHKHISPSAIKTIYVNSNSCNSDFSILEQLTSERKIPLISLNVSLPPEVQVNKNTWTRVIAEYRSKNLSQSDWN
jgi:hypothetical protein